MIRNMLSEITSELVNCVLTLNRH